LSITSREARIQQIKDCGQTIIDDAEKIYGDFKYPIALRITIDVAGREMPTINVDRQFYPTQTIDDLMKR